MTLIALATYQVAATKDMLEEAFAIRQKVFVEEQGVPKSIERDNLDDKAIHMIVIFPDGKIVGTGRLITEGKQGKIGRMAVLPEYRKKGLGHKLLLELIKIGILTGINTFYLHAQLPVVHFYKNVGFKPMSTEEFLEAGISHIAMELRI